MLRVKFIGQAGFIFTFGNISIGMDLYLSDCVEKIDHFKRLTPKVHKSSDLKNLIYILSSHWHYDHFDIDALPTLIKDGKQFIGAYDCLPLFEKSKLSKYIKKSMFMKPNEEINLPNGIKIASTPCDHGESAPLAIGFILKFENYTIYYTSDTRLRLDYAKEIIRNYKIDLLICPINGAFGNMNEYDAVKLTEFIKPEMVIPCHYWMFAEQGGNPQIFKNELLKLNLNTKLNIMMPGEIYELQK
jgi:L-ascorbate 6-phosphate lactonase